MTSVNSESTKNPSNIIGGASMNVFPSRSREHGLSVFHCELPSGAYVQTDECMMAVHQCIEALNGWYEAGTRTVTTFLKMLKGTIYEQIAGQLRAAMMQVREHAGMEMMKLQRNFQTNWCRLSRFSDAANLQTDPGKDSQIVVKELVNFVRCFCQLFLLTSQHLSPFVSSRNDAVFDGRTSVLEELAAISFHHQKPVQLPVGPTPIVPNNRATKVVGGSSPAGLRKQVTSFLSKIGHKSPDTSCFYVPLDAKSAASSTASGVLSSQPSSQNSALETVDGKSNGHVATQEDLDLVISMLSQRTRVPAAGMQSIPEHPLVTGQPDLMAQLTASSSSQPVGAAGLTVGQTLGLIQPIGSELSKEQPHNQNTSLSDIQVQNEKSEAATAEALAKMNTWPFKINQKPFWPNWGDWRMVHNAFGMTDYGTLVKNECAGQPHGTWPVKEMYDQSAATLMPGWGYGGPWPLMTASDVNGSWPSQYSTWNTDCMNSLSKSVSTAVESSSGSEESNCGDQQWMAGGQVPRRRRHSSGEHSLLSQHTTLSNPLPGINISLHGHGDDKPSSWSEQLMDKMTAADDRLRTGHRTLTMQWSDPLANQPLSYWDPDNLSMTKSHSSNASSDNFSKPSASGGNLNKLF